MERSRSWSRSIASPRRPPGASRLHMLDDPRGGRRITPSHHALASRPRVTPSDRALASCPRIRHAPFGALGAWCAAQAVPPRPHAKGGAPASGSCVMRRQRRAGDVMRWRRRAGDLMRWRRRAQARGRPEGWMRANRAPRATPRPTWRSRTGCSTTWRCTEGTGASPPRSGRARREPHAPVGSGAGGGG